MTFRPEGWSRTRTFIGLLRTYRLHPRAWWEIYKGWRHERHQTDEWIGYAPLEPPPRKPPKG
jgi:hypothetical protein